MKKRKKAVAQKAKSPKPKPSSPISPAIPTASFPIVGIGSSAGGLEALELFFKTMPANSGMAFVIVSHLDPRHGSMLSEILQRSTEMPVREAQDQKKIQVDHVYTIPPNKDLTIFHSRLQLSVPENLHGMRLPIDTFFRSLAEDQGDNSICVILSGSGSDGTLGLRAIHGAGGVCFAQEPATAKYDGMPSSAVHSGLASYVLPVEKITEQLVIYSRTLDHTGKAPAPTTRVETDALRSIMMLLRSKTGNDFSLYKQSTIRRRIERRMAVHNVKDMDTYARFLKENPAEVQILFKELLINVTSFFRDKEAFEALLRDALPRLFEKKSDDQVFRIWVPGCASGEEVYSLAILVREYMAKIKKDSIFQIYATDIDEDAISTARAGKYSTNIAIDVSSDRLRQFFVKEEDGYRIKKDIRGMVVFALHNVIKDPPFMKLDIISCRNLMIYLEPKLQAHVLHTFHYALNPGGVLLLSPSEDIGNFMELFTPLDKKWKIFRSKPLGSLTKETIAKRLDWVNKPTKMEMGKVAKSVDALDYSEMITHALVKSFSPPSIMTDEKGNIIYVHGDISKYLKPSEGRMSTNVIDMSREGLRSELQEGLNSVLVKKRLIVFKGLQVETDGVAHGVDLTIQPIADSGEAHNQLLISFQANELKPVEKGKRTKIALAKGGSRLVEDLKKELDLHREKLRASTEMMQSTSEEFKSTNEELQSTNEELQSTNEELETSKEELQSVNEEVVTVNSELRAKIELLTNIQNDMKNLLENVNVGTIFLDDRLRIKLFTNDAKRLFRLTTSDIGRQLADIRSMVSKVDLIFEARGVLDSLVPWEKSVQTTSDEWFLAHIIPYRTLDNMIDGVVLTFSDITELKAVETQAQVARIAAQNIVETIQKPLVVLNGDFEVISANQSFYKIFNVTPNETETQSLFALGDRQWDIPRLHELLETVLPKDTAFKNVDVEHDFPGIGVRKMRLSAHRTLSEAGTTQLILLTMEEIGQTRKAGRKGKSTKRGGKKVL